jgi:hypothetical protein
MPRIIRRGVTAAATMPVAAVIPPIRPYWQVRNGALQRSKDPESQGSASNPDSVAATAGSSTSAESPATTTADGASSSIEPPAITDQPKPPTPKVKRSSPKPEYEHPHKYRGPEIAVLSLQAIWDHLDLAWKQASCTLKTINHLSGWWATSQVVSAHKLDKHQIWLLLFAQYKWWQALEDQWKVFDALPIKDRHVILRMTGVMLEKHSKAVRAERVLAIVGLETSSQVIHRLVSEVKKEKMDSSEKKGDEKKRPRLEVADKAKKVECKEVDQASKRARPVGQEGKRQTGDGRKKVAQKKKDDYALSESDEEEED